jgi:MFS family permease
MVKWFRNLNLSPLLYAAFFMQTGWTASLLTMSFILQRAGGSDTEVGLFFSLQLFFYIITCLFVKITGERLRILRLARFGSAGCILIAGGMLLALVLKIPEASVIKSHHVLVSAGAFYGICMGFFWPAVMAFISAGYEGQTLSRRLGTYNVLVSLGLIVGPFLGGFLVERNSLLPIIASAGFFLFCFLCLLRPGEESGRIERVQEKAALPETQDTTTYNLTYLRIMAGIFLVSTFICGGLRVQMGLLLKFELGFSESLFGTIFVVGCGANLLMYYVLGKTRFWQGRLFLFAIGQILMLASTLLILRCRWLPWFFAASVGYGIAGAMAYSLHQFYSASVKGWRLGALAFHEMIQAGGTIIGSMLSGFLSDSYGRYISYWFSLGVIGLSIVLQILVWIGMKKYFQPGTMGGCQKIHSDITN